MVQPWSPFDRDHRMVFFRVGWMAHYRGITSSETISGGGSYVAEQGYGHEIFNFQPFRGVMYGYVQPPGQHKGWMTGKINLPRLGALARDKSVSDILVIWVATRPGGGAFVVGWYKKATVYKTWQPAPSGSTRKYLGDDCGYYASVSAENAILLPVDKRVFPIPLRGRGGFGQSNIWYADDPVHHWRLRHDVLRYIESGQLPSTPPAGLRNPS